MTQIRRRSSIAEYSLSFKEDNPSSPIFSCGKKISRVVDDLELISLGSKTRYTSLKDLRIQSPTETTVGAHSGYEICIKNPLVKQAAWAYLQPKYVSQNSSGRHFIMRLLVKFSREYLSGPVILCSEFINRHVVSKITCAFHQLFGLIWAGKK